MLIKKINNFIFKKLLRLVLIFLSMTLLLITSFSSSNINACDTATNAGCATWCVWEDCLTSTEFKFSITTLIGWKWDPNSTTSVQKTNKFISSIVELALISIIFISASLIIIWGVFMASSWWNTERINRWKTIIIYNILAIVIALSAYLLVSWVRWLLFSQWV